VFSETLRAPEWCDRMTQQADLQPKVPGLPPSDQTARPSGVRWTERGQGQAAVAPPERLKLLTVLAFTAQSVPGLAMGLLIFVYLSKFYVDAVLMPAGVLAIAIAAGRAADALLDPVVGYLSDHTRSRWGRRKPWIAAGTLGGAVSFYLLLTPPATLTAAEVAWWFIATFVATYIFSAMAQVPRIALSVELTLDPPQRTRLYALSAAFITLGTIIGAIFPTVLQGRGLVDPRAQMRVAASVYVIANLVLNVVLLAVVRERKEFSGRGEVPFVPGVRRALRNRAFRVMFSSHVITAIPFAIPATLLPFFVQYVVRLDATKWTGLYMLSYLGAGFVALPVWMLLARKFGKLRVWFLASFIAAAGGLAMFFVGQGDLKPMLWIEIVWGTQSSVWWFLGGAMHADVIDYDELHTGKRREAQFSALWSIIPKFALIPGAAIPLAVLGAVGYTPNVREQSPEVLFSLRLLFSLVPMVLNIIGLALMRWYPLNETVHRQIQVGIAQRARGEPAIDPITKRTLRAPADSAIDEATGWFLDYFSARLLERNTRVLPSVLAWAGAFGGLTLTAAAYALTRVQRWDLNPGPIPALAIVIAGLSFAGTVFHLLRIAPALQLDRTPPARGILEEHLASLD
jgi:GPH family glycoside/pentoside/hexuronide:cation symporter